MHDLANIIETNFKKKQYTAVVFLDKSGAFDCTWPMAVMSAVMEFGLSVLTWWRQKKTHKLI